MSNAMQTARNNPRAVAGGVLLGVGGKLAEALIPGAAETMLSVEAVGIRGTVSLAARAGRPGMVVLAAVGGAYAGYKIEQNYPAYTKYAADVGSRVEASSGSTALGGIATVATVLPLVWVGAHAYDYITK